MKPFDLVTLLIISNAVQNAMVGADSSVAGGVTAAAIILLFNRGVAELRQRWGFAASVLEGSPSLLIFDGRFIPSHLQVEHVSEEDVMQALREHGLDSVADVKMAVLEVDGTISVVPKEQAGAVSRTRKKVRRQR